MSKKKSKNLPLPCDQCTGLCCRYVAVEVDGPDEGQGIDKLRWYLLHKKTQVFRAHDKHWYLEFLTPCRHVAPDGRCRDYANRPDICRTHGEDGAECELAGDPYDLLFTTVEEFDTWLKRKRK